MNMTATAQAVPADGQGTSPPIQLGRSTLLRGCNRYHASSVIRQPVDFGSLAGKSSSLAGPGFAAAFLGRFRALKTLVPDGGLSAAFIGRLDSPQGAGFEEVLLEAILAVEATVAFATHNLASIAYAAVEQHATQSDLIWECASPTLSRRAARVALTGILELLPQSLWPRAGGSGFDLDLADLVRLAGRRRLSPTTSVLKLAAKKRGLPCTVVGRQHLCLGQGKAQHHIICSMPGTTSIAAQKICVDKWLASRRLAELRLPVPPQIKVGSVEEAHAAAAKLGFPVVIKPLEAMTRSGTTSTSSDESGIELAFLRAHQSRSDVLVERFVPGEDHRLLVIGGRFKAAVLRQPPTLTGDGRRSVGELIDELNADPYRDGFRLVEIDYDDELARLLAVARVDLDTVLPDGMTIPLRSTAKVSTGGVPIDVTEKVHPDNRELAERAAKGVGLDVAGIDFLTRDITRSYREVGGAIVELDVRPNLCMHTWPRHGTARNVAGEVLKLSFPSDADGHIPLIAVAGDRGTGTTARILDRILRGAGRTVALALRRSASVNGAAVQLSQEQQARAAQVLLRDPQVDSVVSTVSLRDTARRGLQLERCTVSIIMDRDKEGNAALFHRGIEVLNCATTGCFVVGAENRLVLDRLGDPGRRQLILVGERLPDEALQTHLRSGGSAVALDWVEGEERIVLMRGSERLAAFPIDGLLSEDSRGQMRRERRATMLAVAAAFGLGMTIPEIEIGLRQAPDAP